MFDVITVGSATIDAFAHTDRSELIKIMQAGKEEDLLAYPTGAKILINRLEFMTGGGGTNSAVSISRLGLKTAWLGMLGRDENAQRILAEAKDEGITFIGNRCDQLTGYSIILDSIEHDRTILAYKGANNCFDFRHVDKKKLKARWFYITAMVEKAYDCMVSIIDYAKQNNIEVMFNPSSYLAEQGIGKLRDVIDKTEILCVNKEEAVLLVGDGSIEQLLSRLLKHVPIVIITDGKDGAYVSDQSHYYHATPPKVKVVETTGAGDAFGSSFLAGYIKKGSIEPALRLAMTNASSVIKYYGAKNKLLTWKQAQAQVARDKIRIEKRKMDWEGLK